MSQFYSLQLNIANSGKIRVPISNDDQISSTEKLVRKEMKKLDENAQEIKHLREQIEKSGKVRKEK